MEIPKNSDSIWRNADTHHDPTDPDLEGTESMGHHNGYLGDLGMPHDVHLDWPETGVDLLSDCTATARFLKPVTAVAGDTCTDAHIALFV